MQLRAALRNGIAHLEANHTPSPRLAAEILLMHALGCDRAHLYTHAEFELSPEVANRYFQFVDERASGKPTQYITGHQEFWGLDFDVNPDVLIPRPETELVVETALAIARGLAAPRIVDVGTGSGCIGLALASELPGALIYATDISPAALAVAARNAERLGLGDRVRWIHADLLSGVSEAAAGLGFDLVASNPPYVSEEELAHVQREVRDYEPHVALGGVGEGTEIYRRLFEEAAGVLAPGGAVIVEVGFRQAAEVAAFLGEAWQDVEIKPDLAGIPRVVCARKTAGAGDAAEVDVERTLARIED